MSATTKRAPLPGKRTTTKAKATRKRGPGRPRGAFTKQFGLPVREAKEPLTIPLLQVDVEKASANKPQDVNDEANFLGCVIAQAVTRACGAERVKIMRREAYVAFPGDKKARHYVVGEKSRRVLEAWDRGEPVVEGVELTLMPPPKSRTLEAQRKARRAYRDEQPHDVGDRTRKTNRKQRRPDPLEGVVRNGNLVKWS